MKTSISSIMSGKPSKGINKYMLEEVYFSESCKVGDEYRTDAGNNPQNARFVDGKYYFNFPDLWYNNMSNNKAIALRKIDLTTNTLNLEFKVHVIRQSASGGAAGNKSYIMKHTVRPNESTFSILTDICRKLTIVFAKKIRGSIWSSVPEKTVKFKPNYDYKTSRATIQIERDYDNSEGETHYFGWYISDFNEDAKHFFNIIQNPINYRLPTNTADGTMTHTFNHIWNREFLFVHASFVNGTSFNYLGRSGEFYPKPSKMYRFGGSSQQFYFELSFDGRNPIRGDERFGEFCIDLAFIYHDKDYQAE